MQNRTTLRYYRQSNISYLTHSLFYKWPGATSLTLGSRIAFLLAGAMTLSACSLVPQNQVRLRLQLPQYNNKEKIWQSARTRETQKTQNNGDEPTHERGLSSAWETYQTTTEPATSFPSDVNEFSCLAINISGPGIIPSLTHTQLGLAQPLSTQTNCIYPGITTRLVSLDKTEVEISVPAGPARSIQILGLVTTDGQCPTVPLAEYLKTQVANSTGTSNNTTTGSPTIPSVVIAELGRSVTDLFKDSIVTVQNNYTSSNPVFPFYCTQDTQVDEPSSIPYTVSEDGLVVFMDAAYASSGVRPSGSCGLPFWENLTGLTSKGVLLDFLTCSLNSGWQGTGDSTTPYYLAFNGLTNMLALQRNTQIEPRNQITVEARIKSSANNLSNRAILNKFFTTTSGSYGLRTNSSGNLVFFVNTDQTGIVNSPTPSPSPTSVWNNTWHVIDGVYDGTSLKLYVDGNSVGTATQATGLIKYGLGDLYLGRLGTSSLTSAFPFGLSGISIYNRALTPAEVLQNCTAFQSTLGNTCAQQ